MAPASPAPSPGSARCSRPPTRTVAPELPGHGTRMREPVRDDFAGGAGGPGARHRHPHRAAVRPARAQHGRRLRLRTGPPLERAGPPAACRAARRPQRPHRPVAPARPARTARRRLPGRRTPARRHPAAAVRPRRAGRPVHPRAARRLHPLGNLHPAARTAARLPAVRERGHRRPDGRRRRAAGLGEPRRRRRARGVAAGRPLPAGRPGFQNYVAGVLRRLPQPVV
jgi:hypothetical protein